MSNKVTANSARLGYRNVLWPEALLVMLCIHAVPVFAVNNSGSIESPWVTSKDIHTNIHYQVGSLVGEPVVNAQIDWQPSSIYNHVPSIYSAADFAANPSYTRSTLVSEAESKLRLYDAKIRLEIRHGNETYYLDADAGVPAKPGKERSFNVPGSPGWESLLTTGLSGRPVPADIAKDIMRAGLNVVGARVTSYKMDTSKFQAWWLEKNADRYTKPLKEAIDRKLQALSSAFGLPVDELRQEVAGARGSGKVTADIAKLQGILDKLSPQNLPKKYLGEGPERLVRLHRYAQSVASADQWLEINTRGLPPMLGTSQLYDNWYQQMEVRLAKNRLQIARLEEKKYVIEIAEREAREVEARERERRERLARAEREAREKLAERRRHLMQTNDDDRPRYRRKNFRPQQEEGFDFFGAVLEGLQNSGWGASGYSGGCGPGQSRVGGACLYVDPNTGTAYRSFDVSEEKEARSNVVGSKECETEIYSYPTFNGDPDTKTVTRSRRNGACVATGVTYSHTFKSR